MIDLNHLNQMIQILSIRSYLNDFVNIFFILDYPPCIGVADDVV